MERRRVNAWAWTVVAAAGVLMLAAVIACQGEKPPLPPAPAVESQPMVEQEKKKDDSRYAYTPIGKRDPMRPPFIIDKPRPPDPGTKCKSKGPECWEIDQLRLVAVVTGTDSPMAQVEDPRGKGHTLTVGTEVGRNHGRVARIKADEVILQEEYTGVKGERLVSKTSLKLPKPAEVED